MIQDMAKVLPLLAAAAVGLAACGGGGGGGGSAASSPGGAGASAPQITSFSPAAAPSGTQVRVQGGVFASTVAGNTVTFNNTPATVLSATPMELVAVVPAAASSGKIKVTTTAGSGTSNSDFSVLSGSVPGTVWTARRWGPGGQPVSLAWNGTRYLAVGRNPGIQSSNDLLIWPPADPQYWLNDVAYDGHQFVAVGNSGLIETSSDGLIWASQLNTSQSALQTAAGNGSTWVVSGTQGMLISSPDALNWTPRNSGTGLLLTTTWTGSRFVAVDAQGPLLTSADGATWANQSALQTSTPTGYLASIMPTAGLLVAQTNYVPIAPGTVYTSADGAAWQQGPQLPGMLTDVIYAGGRYVGVGMYFSVASTDGMHWTSSTLVPAQFQSVIYDGSRYVGIGSSPDGFGIAMTSNDGLAWSVQSVGRDLLAIAMAPGSGGRLVAVGGTPTLGGPTIQTSIDGIGWNYEWTGSDPGTSEFLSDVVWSPSAGGFVGISLSPAATQHAYHSTDGLAWTLVQDPPCRGSLAASPAIMVNLTVITAAAPCLATSTNGTTWTTRTLPATSGTLHKAYWTGSQFIAVGEAGAIATSPDGVTWTARGSGVSQTLNGATGKPGGPLVVVGDQGTLLTSSDAGASWQANRVFGLSASLRRAIWTGSEFFVVGSGGTLLRSPDGANWALQPTQFANDLTDILWSPSLGKLILVGAAGLTATSP